MTEAREIEDIVAKIEKRCDWRSGLPFASSGEVVALIADWRAKKAEIDELRERLFDAESNARDRWD